MQNKLIEKVQTLRTIALRGVVIFPGSTTSFEVGRKQSITAFKLCIEDGQDIFLVPQHDISVDEPQSDDLAEVGVVAHILQQVKLPGNSYQLLVEGVCRAKRISTSISDDVIESVVELHDDGDISTAENSRAIADVTEVFGEYVKNVQRPSPEILSHINNADKVGELCDCIASNFFVNFTDRLAVLLETEPVSRAVALTNIIVRDLQIAELNNEIQSKVRYSIQRKQKEMYLREQLNTIKAELGEDGADEQDSDEYSYKIEKADIPEDVREKLFEENNKLAKMPFGTPEAVVIRNYIETCLELPWNKRSRDRVDIEIAEKILNEDHDGLTKVKERILEFLAVKQLQPELRGQILLFVGPPGVGKTSVAKSIARATNRHFARISLGGIRDEAEIRGHRRTYIGSMPGRVINALKIAGTSNPVILFDELDKLTSDSHGDPTSAMLEVLDPEQNNAFRDNFIEIPVDLSECLFIATANTIDTIPAPLLDRMEIINMSSYSDAEKLSIAKNHLIPKQLKRHGLNKRRIRFSDESITEIIRGYTRENGVRSLEREIASICRKTAKRIVSGDCKGVTVTPEVVHEMLGADKFLPDTIYSSDEVGIVNGLAWTSVGGEMLRIEALSMSGSGHIELTGSLGDVMKESAHAAISYIRKHSAELGVEEDFYKKYDLHIHVPEGAIPKDGPSAGITICTALVSELSNHSVKQHVAMTGEITLTGRVLPIGGLREKSMAAYKAGVTTVIIPAENLPDLQEFDTEIKDAITFIPVKHISEVLKIAINME